MQPAWRPWTADDGAPPSGQTLAISKSKTARPKQQGLRNVTNRQPHAASGERGGPKARLNKPQQSYYGPSPRVLRGQVADAAPAAPAATAVVAAPANEVAVETVARDEREHEFRCRTTAERRSPSAYVAARERRRCRLPPRQRSTWAAAKR